MMRRTALCVGVDRYRHFPTANLDGCVRDAHDMAALLHEVLGFQRADIHLLTNEEATKARILHELERLVEAAVAGQADHLVFTFSGRGTQLPDLDLGEFDRADDAFCPTDLAATGAHWNRDTLLVDDELHDLFVRLPRHVVLEVFLDTCHSGAGIQAADLLMDRRPKHLPPPSVEAFRDIEFRHARPAHVKLMEKGLSHHILWTACKDRQVAVEAFLGGEWRGAFTWHFCQEARAAGARLSRAKLLGNLRLDLDARRFTQVPQLDGEVATRQAPLVLTALPPELEPLPLEMPT